MIFWPLGQVLVVQKLQALALLKQEIIHDVNILIDLIKQIWATNKTLSLIIWGESVKISYDILTLSSDSFR